MPGVGLGRRFVWPSAGNGGGGDPSGGIAWDIGAHEMESTVTFEPEEFDVAGATYYAVAPAGYSYSPEQDTNYDTRKFNTLSAAVAALAASPTTPLVVNIIGDWAAAADTTAAVVSGPTTSAANYLLFRTIGEARPAGVWNSSKYRLETVGSPLRLISAHSRVDGLQIRKTTTTSSSQSPIRAEPGPADNDIRISNCILRMPGNNSFSESCINIIQQVVIAKIWNCVCYGSGNLNGNQNAAIRSSSESAVDIYSCVLIGGYSGISSLSPATVTIKNCYAKGNTAAYFTVDPTMTLTTCASNDATGSPGFQNIAHDATTFQNVTPGSEDYRLADGSPLIDVGTDTSGDAAPLNFAVDTAGQTRPTS